MQCHAVQWLAWQLIFDSSTANHSARPSCPNGTGDQDQRAASAFELNSGMALLPRYSAIFAACTCCIYMLAHNAPGLCPWPPLARTYVDGLRLAPLQVHLPLVLQPLPAVRQRRLHLLKHHARAAAGLALRPGHATPRHASTPRHQSGSHTERDWAAAMCRRTCTTPGPRHGMVGHDSCTCMHDSLWHVACRGCGCAPHLPVPPVSHPVAGQEVSWPRVAPAPEGLHALVLKQLLHHHHRLIRQDALDATQVYTRPAHTQREGSEGRGMWLFGLRAPTD